MTWIKLCGLRTAADVAVAEDVGADAIGLVLAPESPRVLDPGTAATLAAGTELPAYLLTMDAEPDEAVALAERCGVTGLQPHGRHAPGAAVQALAAGLEVLYPVAVVPDADFTAAPSGARTLVDAPTPGSGAPIDRSLLGALPDGWVLAGGLTPSTVAAAVAELAPFGVDVSSGIESQPGVKDHERMRAFVEALR